MKRFIRGLWVRAAGLAFLALQPLPGEAQISDYIRINGYSSFEFEKQLEDEGRGDPNGSFDADLIDLVLNITPTDALRVSMDLTWEHGAATEDGRGNVAVEYAFAEYFVRDWLKLRAGKMFTHFGIYNEIHTAKPAFLTVKEPLATNKNNKFGSELRFYPRWGTGLASVGNGQIGARDYDYVVQVTNGEQEITNPFEEDDNVPKAVLGRFLYHARRKLTFGASFYTDRLSEYDSEGVDLGSRTALLSYGAHVAWNGDPVGIEIEYVGGYLDPSAVSRVNRWATTAMLFARFKERWTPYVRYEFLEPNKDIADDTAQLLVYGINIRVDHGLFLKAELNSFFSGEENSRFEGVNYTEFKAAVAVGF